MNKYLRLTILLMSSFLLFTGCSTGTGSSDKDTQEPAQSAATEPAVSGQPVTEPTASVPPAGQPASLENGVYKIRNKSTGRILSMQNAGMIDGSAAAQFGDMDSLSGLWKIEKDGNYYTIESAFIPRYLSVRGAAQKDGSIIEVRKSTSKVESRLWKLETSDDAIRITAADSGLIMGLAEKSIKSTTPVQLSEFNDEDWKLWTFERVKLQDDLPYMLPVEGTLFHSSTPEIIKYNDTYYMYIMAPGISIKASKDLINWEFVGQAFPNGDPAWMQKEVPGYGIWAPGIYKIKDKYYLYYCISTVGSQNSAIGVAVNTTLDHTSPDFKWVDKGMVIRSHTGDAYNTIDPNIITDDNGDVWLNFGSYWTGIYQYQIDPETGYLLSPDDEPVHLAQRFSEGTAIEAPYMIKRGDYYYLFAAFNRMDQTYHNRVGRSTSVHGPFTDRTGKPMLEGGGTPVTKGLPELWMPGHASVFMDDDGRYYHVGEYFRDGSPSIMYISTIVWDKDGWPVTALTPDISDVLGAE